MTTYSLHALANWRDGGEEEFTYTTRFTCDDLLGILKTYMEFADQATSFVFTVCKDPGEES
jgi:hypothetical protein